MRLVNLPAVNQQAVKLTRLKSVRECFEKGHVNASATYTGQHVDLDTVAGEDGDEAVRVAALLALDAIIAETEKALRDLGVTLEAADAEA